VDAGNINSFQCGQGLGTFCGVYVTCPGSNETGTITASIIDDLTLEFVGAGCSSGTFELVLERLPI